MRRVVEEGIVVCDGSVGLSSSGVVKCYMVDIA